MEVNCCPRSLTFPFDIQPFSIDGNRIIESAAAIDEIALDSAGTGFPDIFLVRKSKAIAKM